MNISNAAASFNALNNEVNRFGEFLSEMHVHAKGHKISALLLASQCQDFSIGLLLLKDSRVLSSRLTLLRGLYEASMRLNYVAIEGSSGALNLEYTDLRARVTKFDLAKKTCPQLQCSEIENDRKRLKELMGSRQEVKFPDVLKKIVEAKASSDYWLYRYWSGFAHSDIYELNRYATKPNATDGGVVTSLMCPEAELVEIYTDAASMLRRAGDCLVEIFKTGSNSNAS